jgi:putative transposase
MVWLGIGWVAPGGLWVDYSAMDIRQAIYTSNAIESMNTILIKVLCNHTSFPTHESAMNVIFLTLNNITKKRAMLIQDWKRELNRFAIELEGRMPS